MKQVEGQAKSPLEAAQQAAGVTWSQILTWSGVGMASLWFYTAGGREGATSESWLPVVSPWDWGLGLLTDIGVNPMIPFGLVLPSIGDDTWFWLLMGMAVFLTLPNGPESTAGVHTSLGTFALLGALSVRLDSGTLITYVLISVIPLIAAVVFDLIADRIAGPGERRDYFSFPSHSFGWWVVGPLFIILIPVLLPLGIILEAARRYRVKREGLSIASSVALRVEQLGSRPLSQAPSSDAVSCVVGARLLCADEPELRKAGRLLFDPGPRGARVPPTDASAS